MNFFTTVRGWQWQVVALDLFTGLSTCISHTARRHICISSCWQSDSTLPNVWTSARGWQTRASPSTSPSRWVQPSPSPLRQRTRVWPRTVQARPIKRQARLPSGEMLGARRPSWKKRQNPVPVLVSTEGDVESGVGLPKQGEYTYKCNICGNGFKSEASVKIHKGKTHTNQNLPEDY